MFNKIDDIKSFKKKLEERNNLATISLEKIKRANPKSVSIQMLSNSFELVDLNSLQRAILVDRYLNLLINIEKKVFNLGLIHSLGHSIIQIGTLATPALLAINNDDSRKEIVFWCTWGVSTFTAITTSLVNLFSVSKRYFSLKKTKELIISENLYASSKGRSGIINPETPTLDANSQKFSSPKFNIGLK